MEFSEILINWYSNNKRDLPWREITEPYRIWLSEIILQQTQVKQGLPYYLSFIETFPTVFDLANADEQHILKLWQGLGYYSRARNLHATAKCVANQLNGKFPDTYEELLKLKGIGDYTASAIASICFNEASAVVDGNVYRVLSRYFGIETPINSTLGKKEFKNLAQELIDKKRSALFNQAIMEFGAVQCRPKNPDCLTCPLHRSCYAFQNKAIKQLPVKLKKQKIKRKYFNFLVVQSENGHTILQKRKDKGIWQNLYQFPLLETPIEVSEPVITKYAKESLATIKGINKVYEYNEETIVHKLSHQHLHTKFWILEVDAICEKGIPNNEVAKYPVPILLGNFIEEFNF